MNSPQYKDILKNPDRAFAKARNYIFDRIDVLSMFISYTEFKVDYRVMLGSMINEFISDGGMHCSFHRRKAD